MARVSNSDVDDAGRLAALAGAGLLDTPAEEPFDRLTRLVSRVLGVPVSLVSLVDSDRQFFKSQVGLAEPWASERQTPLSHSFCQHVVTRQAPLVVGDARADPLVCDNLAIPDLGVAAYLGVPLRTPEGHVLGSLCAIDTVPREWSESDLLTLQDVAHAAMGEVALRAEIARRAASEEQLALLGRELTHRIKNVFSVTGSLLALSAQAAGSVEEVVDTMRRRLAALGRAHDLVAPGGGDGGAGRATTMVLLLDHLLAAYPQERIRVGGDDCAIGPGAAMSLALILHEAATNAVKHGALGIAGGEVAISVEAGDGSTLLDWRETCGEPIGGVPQHQGFGVFLADRVAQAQLGATISRDWRPDGLAMRLAIPGDRLLA